MLNDMPQKNDDRLSVRVPSELRSVLAEIEEKHGYGEPLLARKCLEAVAAFYKQHGFFSFPVKIEPEAGFLERAMQYRTDSAIAGAKAEAAKEKSKRKSA